MKSKILIILCIMASMVFCYPSIGQYSVGNLLRKISPQRNTLGESLQIYFRNHCRDCLGNDFTLPVNNFIPSSLSNFGSDQILNQRVFKFSRNNVRNVLISIYSLDDRKQIIENINNNNNFTFNLSPGNKLAFLNLCDIKAESGTANFFLKNSCSNYINLLIKSEIDIPLVTLKAGYEESNQNSSILLIVKATFISPIDSLIDIRNIDSYAMYYDLWKRYNVNNQNSIYYLNSFDGLTVQRTIDKSSNRKLNYTVDGMINLGFLNIDGTFNGGINLQNIFQGEEIDTYLFLNTTNIERAFKPFPPLTKVQDVFKNFPIRSEALSLSKKVTHIQKFILNGYPKSLCVHDLWIKKESPEDKNPYNEDLVLKSMNYIDSTHTCECMIQGVPKDTIFIKNQTEVPFSLSLETKNTHYPLKLNLKNTLYTTDEPKFEYDEKSISQGKIEDGFVWYVNVNLQDQQSSIRKEQLINILPIQLVLNDTLSVRFKANLTFATIPREGVSTYKLEIKLLDDNKETISILQEAQKRITIQVPIYLQNENRQITLEITNIPLKIKN